MNKPEFQSIDQVWSTIAEGKTIYWSSKAYALTVEPARPNFKPFSVRGDKALRVTCISNYFGSLLEESELSSLFTLGGDIMNTRDGQPCEVIQLNLETLTAYCERRWKHLDKPKTDHMERVVNFYHNEQSKYEEAVRRLKV